MCLNAHAYVLGLCMFIYYVHIQVCRCSRASSTAMCNSVVYCTYNCLAAFAGFPQCACLFALMCMLRVAGAGRRQRAQVAGTPAALVACWKWSARQDQGDHDEA